MQARTLTLESWNGLEQMVTRIHVRTITSESWNGLERMVTRIHTRTFTSESWNGLERMVTGIHARTHSSWNGLEWIHIDTHMYTHLGVVEWFGADGYAPQVDGLLEPRRDPQGLQLLVSVARQLEPAQVLRLFGHRVQSGYLGSNKETVKTQTTS